MAGTNKVLKQGQLLFKAGDPSDGMYIIRQGELLVYLEKDEQEVTLASIGSGGMIGEMALFDRQPRSASVKATADTEVTHISGDDFSRLMKQIPKWFVTLMGVLSTRLRQTNERLQKLETTSGRSAETLIRMLNILILLWHKDGQKDGKDWTIIKQSAEEMLIKTFGEDQVKVHGLMDALVQSKLVSTKQDTYKNILLALGNRAGLSQVVEFIKTHIKTCSHKSALPPDMIEMLQALHQNIQASPYETASVNFQDFIEQSQTNGLDTSKWNDYIPILKTLHEELRIQKASNNSLLIKCDKKEFTQLLRMHRILAIFNAKSLI